MYAPLQQAWTREILLPTTVMDRHFKALMVFLAGFSVLGWTHALIALGLFYAYHKNTPVFPTIIHCSPSHLSLKGKQTLSGKPQQVSLGFCYITFYLKKHPFTVWQWQVSNSDWRCLRALARQAWSK